MARPVTDGKGKAQGTTRAHYEGLIRRGRTEFRETVEGPGLPDYLRPLWATYREVAEGKAAGGMGPSVLAWTDLRAWSEVTGVRPTAWEAEVLFAMDAAVIAGVTGKDSP